MIPLAFALMACAVTNGFGGDQCHVIEHYDTMAQCEERKAYLETYWQAQFDTALPVPVHCEDKRT